MSFRSIVLAKQVPDTKNLTARAMKPDGTVNRAALPAIFNPHDLNALELGLSLSDEFGGEVILITMGPWMAAELVREALYRGADEAVLLTDRRFAGSDTLATSYALAQAVRKVGEFDFVLCGSQAIDGDTAQVGPQVAEKLGLPQLTFVQEIEEVTEAGIVVKRTIENGYERLRSRLSVLLTVTSEVNIPRPPRAKRIMQYKKARVPVEVRIEVEREFENYSGADRDEIIAKKTEGKIAALRAKGLLLTEWNMERVEAEELRCGFAGSPTKVRKTESVVLRARVSKTYEPTEEGINELVEELVQSRILG